MTIPLRQLGDGLTASEISFGAMGMSEFYGTPPEEEASLAVLDEALNQGVTLFDTADVYGRGHNEELIGKFVRAHKTDFNARRLKIATKFGIDRPIDQTYARNLNNSPEYIQKACDASLKRLGLDHIDLYYVHRIDPSCDIADTMGALSRLVKQGKVAHIGLCEVSSGTLRKAHAVHPVSAIQSEYSLWTRDPERSVLKTCSELDIGFVAYSPLGRGFLTGQISSVKDLEAGDFRLSNPRFQGENFQRNLSDLLPCLDKVAKELDAAPAQVALAWLLSRYEKLIVIPGTRKISRLKENCASSKLKLTTHQIDELEHTFNPNTVIGMRYTEEGMKGVGV